MKRQDSISLARQLWPRYAALTGLLLVALARTGAAQGVIAPPPVSPPIQPVYEQGQTNQLEAFQFNGPLPRVAPEAPPLQWGPVGIRPHIQYRFLYGDGIQVNTNQPIKTAINEISPGVLLEIGRHWTLDYTPTMTFYSSSKFSDTTAQNVTLTGGATYDDWAFGLSQNYSHTVEPLVETGAQTSQDTYSTAVTATHQLSQKMLLELAANQEFTFPDGFTETREWSTLDWLNYQFWPRFSAALGAGAGYSDVDVGNDSISGQLQGRGTWQAADKLSLQVSGGAELLHFTGGGKSDVVKPVYAASIQYQPTEATTVSLSANGDVGTTFFTNEVSTTTGVSVTLNQRLLKKVYLTLTGGYQNTKYSATQSGVSSGRNDDTYSFNARLSTRFLKRATAAVFYQYSDNSSNEPGYSYISNQGGVELGYAF
ncbi:MAG: outer membrane beta-barrel protein [Verrucomicrobiota bacterium]